MLCRATKESIKLIFDDNSYNRYLAIAARTIRRSLNEEKRLAAERRGDMDLRFAKWEVRLLLIGGGGREVTMMANA